METAENGVAAMTEADRLVLTEFAARVRERFPGARVVAFGSRARGDAAPDSDFDVCVVVDSLDEKKDREIMGLAWEVGFAHDVLISTVTFSSDELASGPMSESPIIRKIESEGVAA